MRLLFIEDDISFAKTFLEALRELESSINCTTARSKSSAVVALEHSEYDLIICDLSLPSVDDALDEDPAHGVHLYQHARRKHPGTPVYLLTGHGEENIDFVTEALVEAPKEDIFGVQVHSALTDFIRKARLDDCITKILDFSNALRALDGIEVDGMQGDLSPYERRLLRIFARRHSGAIIKVSPLSGGLSSSKTLRVGVRDAQFRKTANTVAKIGPFEAVEDELRRYRRHVAPLLGPGSFTTYAGEVRAGAGQRAGVFYTLAEEYRSNLFDILSRSEDEAIEVLERIVELEHPWTSSQASEWVMVEKLRQKLMDDDSFANHSGPLRSRVAVDRVERAQVLVKRSPQHGDLHGLNVLVSDDKRPVLIDYGDVGVWCSSYDMLVLELSVLFHPAAQHLRGDWPSVATARNWDDLDIYCDKCPFPLFIRACREHAIRFAAGRRELMANAYAYSVRQLKYPDTDKDLALAIAETSARIILEN